MKKMIALILAYVSLLFFTLMRFGKNAVEAYLSVQLIINNHPVSSAVVVRTRVCETVLIVLAVICLVIAIVETLREKKK